MDRTAPQSSRDEGLTGILRRGDLAVLAVAALLLLGGWLLRARHVDRSTTHRFQQLQLELPSGWIALPEGRGGRRVLADVLATEAFPPRVVLWQETPPPGVKPAELASYLELNLQGRLQLFHLVATRSVEIDGHRAFRLDYAYAVNPGARPDEPAATDVPVAVRASSLAVELGGELLRVDVQQSTAQHRERPDLADRILTSVRVIAAGGSR